MIIDESKIIEEVDEEKALACLLAKGICFINNIVLEGKNKTYTIGIYVLVSDIFAWGCADAEPLICNDGELPNEIIDLYRLQKEQGFFGIVHWACLKRKQQPQLVIKKEMILAGYWTDELKALKIK